MTSRASPSRSAQCRSSGGQRIPSGIPGSGEKSLHGAVKWPMGKFFDKKAGFISREWLPYFLNFRRDGYDFDALWEDGKASYKQKRIMDLYAEELQDREYYSNELKQTAGFGKDGEKGFEGVITGLQMQLYLCVRDFRQRKNKKGESYG